MTRINTNVSSLVAQNRLQSSNNDLQQSLTRLSTGLRINSGSDDPAGLLASEALRSEITGLTKSISNTQRASQIISTADSALGQVSNLLNDVRGLVVEAANSGALSKEEIAANQLQIDSSLEAINRIAQTTTFQGRKLLDGSQDFVSTIGSVSSVSDVSIDQANLGKTGQIDVEVVISSAAEKASATASDAGFSAAAQATSTTEASVNTFTIGDATNNVTIEGQFDSVVIEDGGGGATTAASITDGVLTITVDDAATVTGAAVATVLNGVTGVYAEETGTLADVDAAAAADATAIEGAGLAITAADAGGDYNNVSINYVAGTGATTTASYDDEQKSLTVTIGTGAGENSLATIAAAINSGTTEFDAEVADGSGSTPAAAKVTEYGEFTLDTDNLPAEASTGNTGGEVLNADLVFQLSGSDGAETFNFGAGTTKAQIAAAVNLVSDSTGVEADSTSGLEFTSTGFGSDALVDIDVISEGAGGTFKGSLDNTRSTGADIVATVNGVEANGSGNSLSINTSSLDLSLTVDDGSSTNFSFSITGGGATFQLGPDVTSTQQASLGIGSVSTGQLGGASGRLYELGSGQAKSLTNDVEGAAKVIDEVIGKVVGLRGRLGSFQSTTLESNLVSLNETKANLQEAESSIRDADFAQESANLTRAQILVQSGTNVLSLANQNPRNVLSLLG
ncbi:flagellin N-terminal helical domain-containing protein [Rhodopirellula halodulae]|uniref:flagellin N-terminal helical domain-containing protein n=1 Tax=Rhodopirellula halodulae TaxID=2894198 RepID=UPI001E32F003|nr:flagellin [Rhodopirellula sp. JC737]MCC9658765.1 flagellin [Rhodopirellula sp. JC737]